MRSHVKKKNYKVHVRSQVLSGKTNRPDTGQWVDNDIMVTTKGKDFSLKGVMGKGSRK